MDKFYPFFVILPQWKNLSGYCDYAVIFFAESLKLLPQWKNLSGYCDDNRVDSYIITNHFLNGKTFRGIATVVVFDCL